VQSPDPHAPAVLALEARLLCRVLLVNIGLNAGYLVGGAALWWPRAAGAAAGVSEEGS
jgi:hypothetical protein